MFRGSISVTGAVASIYGAVLAWKQNKKAEKSASHAKSLVDRFLNNTRAMNLASAITSITTMNRFLVSYGPSFTEQKIMGLDFAQNASDIQLHFEPANSFVQQYSCPNAMKSLFSQTNDLILQFANSKEVDEIKQTGYALYLHGHELSTALNKHKLRFYNDQIQ